MTERSRAPRAMDLRGEPGGDAPRDAHIRRTPSPSSWNFDLGLRDMIKVSLGMKTADRIQGPLAFTSIAVLAILAGVAFCLLSVHAGGGYYANMSVAIGVFAAMMTCGMWFNWHTIDRVRREIADAAPAGTRPTRPAARKTTARKPRATTSAPARKNPYKKTGPLPPEQGE
ncbi:hypothetical protein O7632_08260 [Solwaraspora sp. WMMD406]|uniref:hypothetical protein n=1 Tax=Solwaraspora sp. WMMD406 TaxID=3016095 RepID=UPI002415F744|nr:hypothetical protein [Solwaraspora sp. WMMD406]MDG4764098.1 hypothetical protein [Solwaraspora sp. WMMD406]